jgi:hypothetical protein
VVFRSRLRQVTDAGAGARCQARAIFGSHSVALSIDYPVRPLNRLTTAFRPFVARPILILLAWFAILFTGRYPRGLFEFVVGVGRWHPRVVGYAYAVVTDAYPPFRLGP